MSGAERTWVRAANIGNMPVSWLPPGQTPRLGSSLEFLEYPLFICKTELTKDTIWNEGKWRGRYSKSKTLRGSAQRREAGAICFSDMRHSMLPTSHQPFSCQVGAFTSTFQKNKPTARLSDIQTDQCSGQKALNLSLEYTRKQNTQSCVRRSSFKQQQRSSWVLTVY